MSEQAVTERDDQHVRLDRVLGLVNAMLARTAAPPASAEQDLRQAGLSSLDTVNLMLAVEGEFDLFLPSDQMTPENFHSAAAIAAMVGRVA